MKRILLILALLCAMPAQATVTSATTRQSFTSAGGAEYDFTFKAYSASHIEVYVNDAKQSTGLYAVTLNPTGGGRVTFMYAPAAGVVVKIQRVLPLTQTTAYTPYSAFSATTHERSLDLLAMQIQQLQTQYSDGLGPAGLSVVGTCAGGEALLGFDGTGAKVCAAVPSGSDYVTLGTQQTITETKIFNAATMIGATGTATGDSSGQEFNSNYLQLTSSEWNGSAAMNKTWTIYSEPATSTVAGLNFLAPSWSTGGPSVKFQDTGSGGAALLVPKIDTASGTQLSIGTTTATEVMIGRSGQTVVIDPDATFSASGSLNGNASTASALYTNPTPCSGQFVTDMAADGTLTCTSLPDTAASTKGVIELDTDLGGTAAAPQVVATHLAAPLPAAQGGLGAAQPTCATGQFLTCNGSTCACSTATEVSTDITTADYTMTSTTPAPIDSSKLTMSLVGGGIHRARCSFVVSGTSTSAPKFSWVLSGGAAESVATVRWDRFPAAATTLVLEHLTSITSTTTACTTSCLNSTRTVWTMDAIVVASGTGTATAYVASSTEGQAVTVYNGSWCLYR